MPPSTAYADAIEDQLTEFKALVESGDEARVLTAIESMRRKRDKRVDAALLAVVRFGKMERADAAAMRVLGIHADSAYLGWVRSKLGDRKLLAEHPARFLAMLDSLPAAGGGLKPILGAVADCIDEHLTSKPDVATRAILAYSSAGSDKAVIDQLIGWLDRIENGGGSGGGARGGVVIPPPTMNGGGGGNAGGAATSKEKLLEALERLTGARESGADAWKAWWAKNKASFKPQPARPPEPEWATLREFDDPAYGFILKKPAADACWLFERCDADAGRVRLRFQKGADTMARVDVTAPRRGSMTTAALFAESLVKEWRKSAFTEFFPGGEPEAQPASIGGREFVIVRARGIATGAWKDWDACERRAYVTAGDADTFLCFDAILRTGWTDAAKAAVWAGVEATRFADSD